MRQRYIYTLLLVSCFLAMVLLSGCGGNTGQQATATSASDALIETSTTLSLVRSSDGSTLWSISSDRNSQPLVVEGKRVYYSISNMVVAVDLSTGHQLWTAPLDRSATNLQASSTQVYVLAGNLLSAFDATTGALKWRVDQIDRDGVRDPFVLSSNTIYTTASGVVTALSATTGAQLWQFVPPTLQDVSQPRVDSLLLSSSTRLLVISYHSAVYAIRTDSQPTEAWHLDPTSTDSLGFTSHQMTVLWAALTSDNHVLLTISLAGNTQFERRYLALSTGSQVWSAPFLPPSLTSPGGIGYTTLVDTSDFYTLGGSSNGDVSAMALSNHQRVWIVSSSGSYTGLFVSNDIVLASNNDILTALSTSNGQQLWQKAQSTYPRAVFLAGQQMFIQQPGQLGEAGTLMALDLHSGQKMWSLPTPDSADSPDATLLNVLEVQPK